MRLLVMLTLNCLCYMTSFSQSIGEQKPNKEIAFAYISEVVNKRNLTLIKDIYSDEYVFHGMDETESHTIRDSSLASFLAYLFKAFPDLHYTIDNAVSEGELVALNLTAT